MERPKPFDAVLTEHLRKNTFLLGALSLVGTVLLLVVEAALLFNGPLVALRAGAAAALAALLLTFRRERSPPAVVGFAFGVYLCDTLLACAAILVGGPLLADLYPTLYLLALLPAIFFCHRPGVTLALVAATTAPMLATTVLVAPGPPPLGRRVSAPLLLRTAA